MTYNSNISAIQFQFTYEDGVDVLSTESLTKLLTGKAKEADVLSTMEFKVCFQQIVVPMKPWLAELLIELPKEVGGTEGFELWFFTQICNAGYNLN